MSEPGESRTAPDAPASQAARQRAVDALTSGYTADHLTEAELEQKLDRVYRATTLAELEALTASLPVMASDGGGGEGRSLARRGSEASLAAAPRRVRALLSGQESVFTGVVPRRVSLVARMGYVEVDMTRATFEPGVTEIAVHSMMGYVQILLPRGVRVESDGHAILGYFAVRGGQGTEVGGAEVVVRLTGRAVLGYAECFTSSKEP